MVDYTPFMNNEWKWLNDNTDDLSLSMSEHDRSVFGFDLKTLHWKSYYENAVIGLKKYVFKEDDQDKKRMAVARSAQRRLKFFSFLMRAIVLGVLLKVLLPILRARGMTKSVWLLFAPLLMIGKKMNA